MERKDGSRTAVGGFPIAVPTKKGDVIVAIPQKNIPAVFMVGCVLWPRQGWALTGERTLINVLLPIGAGSPRGQCLPERKSPIS